MVKRNAALLTQARFPLLRSLNPHGIIVVPKSEYIGSPEMDFHIRKAGKTEEVETLTRHQKGITPGTHVASQILSQTMLKVFTKQFSKASLLQNLPEKACYRICTINADSS